MFTKNYYAALGTAFMESTGTSGMNAVDYNGNNRTLYNYTQRKASNDNNECPAFAMTLSKEVYSGNNISADGLSASVSSSLAQNAFVYFGKGTTPATLDDYKLESRITSGMTINEQSIISSLVDNVVTKKASYILKNTSSSDITIGEIGIYRPIFYGTGSVTYFLLERTVLDEPITIPSGGTGTVTYTIKIQVPTAPTE